MSFPKINQTESVIQTVNSEDISEIIPEEVYVAFIQIKQPATTFGIC